MGRNEEMKPGVFPVHKFLAVIVLRERCACLCVRRDGCNSWRQVGNDQKHKETDTKII